MADNIIAATLQVNGDQAVQSVKSFKSQLREAQQELLAVSDRFGDTSMEAAKAAARVAELRDAIGDANTLVDAFNPDQKFAAFAGVLQTVAGGFAAVTGAMGLAGAESENVEKALLKVQSALAISEGLNSVLDGVQAFKAFGLQIKSTAAFQKIYSASTAIASAVTKAFGVSVETTAVGFKVLRGAIIATGIGALVVGIGLLISNFDKVKEAVFKFIPGLKAVGDFLGKIINSVTDFVGVTSDATRALDKLTAATKKNNEAIDNGIALLEAQGGREEKIYQLKKKRANGELALIRAKLDAGQKLTEEENRQARDLHLSLKLLDIEEAKRVKKIEDDKKKEADEKYKKWKAEQDKLAKERAKYQLNIQEGDRAHEAQLTVDMLAEAEKRGQASLDQAMINHDNQMAATEQMYADLAYMNMSDLDKQLVDLSDFFGKKMEAVKGNAEAEKALTEEYERQKTALVRAENERRLALVSNLLGQASNLMGQHTAAGKVLAIAQTTIDTYQSATAAYKSMASIPVVGPALGAAAAGIAIASGLKNIKEIMKVKVPGAAGAMGSMPGVGSAPSAPIQPQLVQTSTKLDSDALNKIGNAASGGTNRSYVVESDITNSQAREAQLARAARLGG